MNPLQVTLAAVSLSLVIAFSDIPGKMTGVFDDSIVASRMVTTAGDLHSMSVMLDATYIMDRYLPAEAEFPGWLAETFKKNELKGLSVDYWGHPYLYTVSADRRRYQLRSTGPDGIAGTGDDMVKSGP